jgi:4-methyl-5(b-hydroxyethyl)-thiazole monophosphate biosynthesis
VAVTTASLDADLSVCGCNQITVQADTTLDQALQKTYDTLVLPGGPGYTRLRADPRIKPAIQAQAAAGRVVAAICAAPTLLLDAGLLTRRRYACHFSVKNELPYGTAQAVVEDGNLITSQGPGTAVAFGLAILARLVNPAKARRVATGICHVEE